MGTKAWLARVGLATMLAGAPQALAGTFPIVLQTLCDPDFPSCPPGGVQGLRGVRDAAVSPDDKHVYFVISLDDALIVFARDAQTGRLTFVESHFDTDMGVDGLDSARGVAISPDGAHVYVAALLDSSLAAWARDAMTGALTLIEVEKDGVAGVDGLAGAHDVALSGGGEHVYVASRSEDAVAVFSRNAVNGQLNFLEFEKDGVGPVDGLDGAEGVAVSDDDEHVYVAANVDDAVAVFKREDNSGSVDFGKLTFIEAKKDGVGGVDGLDGAGDVTLDSNGQSVYVASERTSGGGDWAAVFSRETNPVSIDFGKLTLVEDLQESDFGTGSTGIFVGCLGVGPDNSGVAVTPDDSQVYLTNSFRGTVAVFDRSGGDGSLTLADSNCDLTFGLDGLAGTVGIAFDSDGERAYTVAPSFEAMAVLCTESGGCWI